MLILNLYLRVVYDAQTRVVIFLGDSNMDKCWDIKNTKRDWKIISNFIYDESRMFFSFRIISVISFNHT